MVKQGGGCSDLICRIVDQKTKVAVMTVSVADDGIKDGCTGTWEVTMPYYTKDQIDQARELDLLTYLRQHDPNELVHFSGNTYTTRTYARFSENLQWKVVLVVPWNWRHKCSGLSCFSTRPASPGCRNADHTSAP